MSRHCEEVGSLRHCEERSDEAIPIEISIFIEIASGFFATLAMTMLNNNTTEDERLMKKGEA